MTSLIPNSVVSNIRSRTSRAAVATKLRPWFTAHLVTVRRALAWYGVTGREDRADLAQDVFFSAYLALDRGEQIENPRAWLRECARKHASNYRHKEARRSPHTRGELLVYGMDPEQLTSDRERLHQALAVLTEDARAIVFDIHVDGMSWGEVARERSISIDKARWIGQRAISQMDKYLFDSEKTRFTAALARLRHAQPRATPTLGTARVNKRTRAARVSKRAATTLACA